MKRLHDLDRNLNKLGLRAPSQQQKFLHLASKATDKQFAKWTKDQDLLRRMHSYQELADLMVERVEVSVALKYLLMNRGIATSKTRTRRYQSKDSAGTSATEGVSTPSQPSGSKAPKPNERGDLKSSLKAPGIFFGELRRSEIGEKPKGTGKSGGKGRGKGSAGGRGTGKFRLLDAETLTAEFKVSIQCKHCGKMRRNSDHWFKYLREHRFQSLNAFLKQQGFSEQDIMKVLPEMKNRPNFSNDKPLKLAAKPKPAVQPAIVSSEEAEDPAAKKRK